MVLLCLYQQSNEAHQTRENKMTKQEKVLKILIKRGVNEIEAKGAIDKNFDIAISCCPDAKPSWIADFVSSVY